MQKQKPSDTGKDFVKKVQSLEASLFSGQLDESDPVRMKNIGKYSWLYRPSHHIATGLVTKKDIADFSVSDKRLLSIGAHPGSLEQLLAVVGIPAKHITIADKDSAIAYVEGLMERACFDATGIWPDIGTFDLIIFPESLCMIVGGDGKKKQTTDGTFPSDASEAEALASVLYQALMKLRPGGEIRANGPMSHPNVVKAASEKLRKQGCAHSIDYDRYFLTVCATDQ